MLFTRRIRKGIENCTGGKVGILSAAPLSLRSQELNINHMRRRKVVLIKLQRCFIVRISVSDRYQLRKKIKEAGQDKINSRIEVCFHLWLEMVLKGNSNCPLIVIRWCLGWYTFLRCWCVLVRRGMEGTTPTFAAVVTARSNHSVQMSSMLSRMSWRSSVTLLQLVYAS